jgi:acyl carrier protein
MRERVRALIASVFDISAADVPDDARATTLAGWDSLRHLELMLAIEREFSIRIPTDRLVDLVSLDDLVVYLESAAAQ